MKRLLSFFVLCALIHVTYNQLSAQSTTYTDHKPTYRKWQDDYILDKISYTSERTIFYFRFVCKSGKYTNAIFYPPGGEHPWYLKGRNVKKNYYLKELKYIRRNGKLMKSRVRSSAYSVSALEGAGYTVFSCEVHFERLPNDVTTVDLIEGKGQEYNKPLDICTCVCRTARRMLCLFFLFKFCNSVQSCVGCVFGVLSKFAC